MQTRKLGDGLDSDVEVAGGALHTRVTAASGVKENVGRDQAVRADSSPIGLLPPWHGCGNASGERARHELESR